MSVIDYVITLFFQSARISIKFSRTANRMISDFAAGRRAWSIFQWPANLLEILGENSTRIRYWAYVRATINTQISSHGTCIFNILKIIPCTRPNLKSRVAGFKPRRLVKGTGRHDKQRRSHSRTINNP